MSARILHLPASGVTAAQLGGKGANLQRLLELGARVPPAAIIPAGCYRDHVGAPAVQEAIRAALAAPPESREAALASLRRTFVEQPLDSSLERELAQALETLGGGALAVRSSAVGEDGSAHSFAGQHDTYLGVEGLAAAAEAVRRCWASAWTARAVEYRARKGLDPRGVEMAVVVQRLIPAEVSGVLFTCDPVSGRSDRVVIEAVFGLGETLVSGRASPDRVVLARPGLEVLERTTSEKRVALVAGGAGKGAIEEALPPERAQAACLGEAVARQLAEEGLRLERALGGPQDIEWALSAEQVHILQARPVTTAAPLPAKAGPRLVWSNTNTGELLPGVATPLTYGLIEKYVTMMLGELITPLGFDLTKLPLVGRVGGRMYFCMNTFLALMRAMPGMSGKSPADFFGGDPRMAEVLASLGPDELPALEVSFWRLLAVAPKLGFKFLRHLNVRAEPIIEVERTKTARLASVDLTALSGPALIVRFDELLGDMYGANGALMAAMAGISCANGLVTVCRKWLGDADGSLANRLLSGVGGLDSAEAGMDLWRVAQAGRPARVREVLMTGQLFAVVREQLETFDEGRAFLARWDDYLARHGHHARSEVDVAVPRWREQPDAVLATVRAFLSGDSAVDPEKLHAQRAAEREQLTAECLARLRNPAKRAVFQWLLPRAQRGFAARENLKSEAVRRIAMMREACLEAGRRLVAQGRLGKADDVFFLQLDELEAELCGRPRDEAVREVPKRRRELELLSRIQPPPLVVGEFDPARYVPEALAPVSVEGPLKGLAVSPGVAVGRARVVLNADPDVRVYPGEILVAPFTDPGWTPYFVAAAAVVVDMGGMLSHGSVVAREYGIPAVVNVGHGTRTLKTGQLVRVDGFRGEVTVLEESDSAEAA